MSKNLVLLWGACVFLGSCAGSGVASHPSNAAQAIPPPAKAFQSTDPNQETIAVVAINDVHGTILPKERKLADGRIVKSGGAEALASYIKILRDEMNGKVAVIDAGDEWQGTLESNLSKGGAIVQFYNLLGVNVAAIGNHEFDFGIPSMTKQFGKANYPYVAANIYNKKSSHRPKWKNVKPSALFEVAGYKIGVVGYSTIQTPTTTRYENVKHLDFRDPIKPLTEESAKLRKEGADLVLVTAHAGTVCEDKKGLKDWKLWNKESETSTCDESQEIVTLAKGLKPGQVDGIIAGHTHQITHHFFNQIPVVQDEAFNQFFNVIYYTFDRKTHKLLPELTEIESLIPLCFQTFEKTSHCDVRRLPKDASPKLTQAYFHGHAVLPDPKIAEWIAPVREASEKFRKQVMGYSELPLNHERDRESPLGNLVADIFLQVSHADFSLVNAEGVRASLDAGPITYDALYRALPFDNILDVVTMTGAQVKLFFRLATSGATNGLPAFAGLKVTVVPLDQDPPKDDLNHDGKIERFEFNRLVKLEPTHGKPIEDQKLYKVATYDYLVTGGDHMALLFDQIPKSRILHNHYGFCRDIVADYLGKHKVVNTKEAPLYLPSNPRLLYQSAK